MKASLIWIAGLILVAGIVVYSNQSSGDLVAGTIGATSTNCGGHSMQDNYGNWVCQAGMVCPKGSKCRQVQQYDSKTKSWEPFCGCVPSPSPKPRK